jgi:hypothetical protein
MQAIHHHITIEVEGCKNHTNKTNTIQGRCSKKLLVERVSKKDPNINIKQTKGLKVLRA